ncbi:MAG: toll/interleukin-1 receptor domain-containing protein [Acidobacteriota bacterium]
MDYEYDLFLSHASEDKAELVEPLVRALEARGLTVWYDRHQITLGDDFRRKMDDGLAGSRFGVVVLSPSFQKYWTETELSALMNLERVFGSKRILSIVHRLSPEQVASTWPTLGGRAKASSSDGVDSLADQIRTTIQALPQPKTGAPSRLYGDVPYRSHHFVGRTLELTELEAMVTSTEAGTTVSATIEGLAGIGKTELAAQLVHRLSTTDSFPGGIFWLPSEEPNLTSIWGGVVADKIGSPAGPVDQRAHQAIHAIEQRGIPTLIVLDNVEGWARDKRPQPLPAGHHIRLLITTRRHNLGGGRFTHLELGFLAADKARELLVDLAGTRITEAAGCNELLDYLDGHALAIELAGAYLGEYPNQTPASYLEGLREGSTPDDKDLRGEVVRYEKTVDEALDMTWQRLDDELCDAWCLAACFAPEAVRPELSEAAGLTPQLPRLRRLHLIELADDGAWRMHRLVRAFARRAEADRLAAAQRLFLRGCAALIEGDDYALWHQIYLPNRVHLDLAVSIFDPGEDGYGNFLSNIAIALRRIGELDYARRLHEQALESDLHQFGDDHPNVATRRSNLALVMQDLGDLPGAKELLEKALESDFRQFGENHPKVAIRRSNLATVLKGLGDLTGAKELLKKALESGLRQFGDDHPNVAIRRSNLAMVLEQLGDFVEARELASLAYERGRRALGDDHPHVAIYRNNLADLDNLGD